MSTSHRTRTHSSLGGGLLFLIIPVLCLLVLLGTSDNVPGEGPTEVSGMVSNETYWTLENSPYIVKGDVVVNKGATLWIEPGVEVRFDVGYDLRVLGTLAAQGNETHRIVFTSNSSTPEPGSWGQIWLAQGSGYHVLSHCDINYATDGVYSHVEAFIRDCLVSDCSERGIVFDGAQLGRVLDSTIRGGRIGILLDNATISVLDNVIDGCDWAGVSCQGYYYKSSIRGNVISNHTSRGIEIFNAIPIVRDNLFVNSGAGIFAQDSGSEVEMLRIRNNTFIENYIAIIVWDDSHVNVTSNNIMRCEEFDVYCSSTNDVDARLNYWGTDDNEEIEDRIYHHTDNWEEGTVLFLPVLGHPNVAAPAIPGYDYTDSDEDGVVDLADAFPDDPSASIDSDQDGHPDGWNAGRTQADSTTGLELDAFPDDPTEWADTDDDGIGDNRDAFPRDPAASVDTDLDGYPDEWNDGRSQEDSTTGLRLDAFPDDPTRWGDEEEAAPTFPSIAASVGLLGLLVLLVTGLTDWGKVRFFALAFPLFSRMRGAKVLDQFTRGQVYGVIRTYPGINYSRIKRVLLIGNGNLSYHLSVLEKEGFVRSETEGIHKLFYPTKLPARLQELEGRFPSGDGEGILMSDLQDRMLSLIQARPGLTQAELVSILKVPKQTVSYNIKHLVEYELVQVRKEGNRTRCFPTGGG